MAYAYLHQKGHERICKIKLPILNMKNAQSEWEWGPDAATFTWEIAYVKKKSLLWLGTLESVPPTTFWSPSPVPIVNWKNFLYYMQYFSFATLLMGCILWLKCNVCSAVLQSLPCALKKTINYKSSVLLLPGGVDTGAAPRMLLMADIMPKHPAANARYKRSRYKNRTGVDHIQHFKGFVT